MKIIITEKISDHRRPIEGETKLHGNVYYTYESPTHWGSDGCCRVTVSYSPWAQTEVSLSYASGGWNKGFTDVQIAEAMSKAFAMAANRINQVEEEIENEATQFCG